MFAELKSAVEAALSDRPCEDGVATTVLPGLTVIRSENKSLPTQVLYKPVLAIAIQGNKQVSVGESVFRYADGRALVVGIDVPAFANVTGASPAKPYLGLALELDFSPMRDAAETLAPLSPQSSQPKGGIFVYDCPERVMECLIRLLKLASTPQAIPAIQPLIVRELCYWMLSGPQGEEVRRLVLAKGAVRRVLEAVHALRMHYQQPIRIEELAAAAAMSPASFYQHFKALTSMTPLQYQKQMRLLHARSLLGESADNITQVAYTVGYGSVSQFHREYKRAFGDTPRNDVMLTASTTKDR